MKFCVKTFINPHARHSLIPTFYVNKRLSNKIKGLLSDSYILYIDILKIYFLHYFFNKNRKITAKFSDKYLIISRLRLIFAADNAKINRQTRRPSYSREEDKPLITCALRTIFVPLCPKYWFDKIWQETSRNGAVVARRAHNPEVDGANPSSATQRRSSPATQNAGPPHTTTAPRLRRFFVDHMDEFLFIRRREAPLVLLFFLSP